MVTLDFSTKQFLSIASRLQSEEKINFDNAVNVKSDKEYWEVPALGLRIKCWRKWVAEDGPAGLYDGHGEWENVWHLEFDTEEQRTFFTLKYFNDEQV